MKRWEYLELWTECASPETTPPHARQWEWIDSLGRNWGRTLELSTSEALNRLGREGWELAALMADQRFLLKRPLD